MTGKKHRSGPRPKDIDELVGQSLTCVRRRLPDIMAGLVDRALQGDKEVSIYLVDRVLGKPRMEIDSKVRMDLSLDPSRLADYIQQRRLEASNTLQIAPPTLIQGSHKYSYANHDDDAPALDAEVGRGLAPPNRIVSNPAENFSSGEGI